MTVRDPRAAARSAVHHATRPDSVSPGTFEEMIAKECTTNFIPWLQGWIASAQNAALPYKVHWVPFSDIKRDLPATVRRVCSVLRDRGIPRWNGSRMPRPSRRCASTTSRATTTRGVPKSATRCVARCGRRVPLESGTCWRSSRSDCGGRAQRASSSPFSARSISARVFSTP